MTNQAKPTNEMNIAIIAVFPLGMVKQSIQSNKKDYQAYGFDSRSFFRSMRPAVKYTAGDCVKNVHCGSLPLIGVCYMAWRERFYTATQTCYINEKYGQCYPC